jgi:predicted phosphodiesterase
LNKKLPFQHVDKPFAVISDIHSNFQALRQAFRVIDSRDIDYIIILGDLLTYGCDVVQTLDLIEDIRKKYPTYILKGNHDQFYFDMQSGSAGASYEIPGFINDSVQHNLQKLRSKLADEFDWEENICLGDMYFAHANPYAYGNWQYLNSESEIAAAAARLRGMKFRFGFFGHTHRARLAYIKNGKIEYLLKSEFSDEIDRNQDDDVQIVVNPGSCGQPRGESSSFLIVKPVEQAVAISCIQIEYDIQAHINSIRDSTLPEETKQKLIAFFD